MSGEAHSKARDEAAISHHYDFSNAFYRMVLDPRMAYSCGYWTSDAPGYTVEDAQRDKLDLGCAKLGLEPGMRMLDVGRGWGSLAIHAARHHGVHVAGTTLAREQREFVLARLGELGLADRVEVRLQDYHDLAGEPFDAIGHARLRHQRAARQVRHHRYRVGTGLRAHRACRPGTVLQRRSEHPPRRHGAVDRRVGRPARRAPCTSATGAIAARAGGETRARTCCARCSCRRPC